MDKFSQIESKLEQNGYNGVVLIAKGSEVLFANAYGLADHENNIPNTRETVFNIASVTKQFTAASILKLYQENKLNLDDRLEIYIPDFIDSDKITIHHLLSNSSGIANFSLDMDFTEILASDNVLKALIDYIKDKPLMFEPGSQFFYSISGYQVLQYIIETVSQIDYDTYLKENFFIPLEMVNSGFDLPGLVIPNKAKGYDSLDDDIELSPKVDMRIAGGGGGLFSTVDDLLKWKLSIQNHLILNEDMVELMFTGHVRADDVNSYAYGMIEAKGEIWGKERTRYYHAGGSPGIRAFYTIYPEQDYFIIMISNLSDPARFNKSRNDIDEILLTN